jgi:hypothetical protein
MDTASDPQAAAPAPEEFWAKVEIFGHRKHYGRVSEVEKFGTRMLRIDVPLAEPSAFETFLYGGSSIFGIEPMTEEACRRWAEHYRPHPYVPSRALPPPAIDADVDVGADEEVECDGCGTKYPREEMTREFKDNRLLCDVCFAGEC